MRHTLRVFCVFALVCALGRAETLESVMARMDKAAPAFKSMEADVQMVTYTAVIQDNSTESGHLQMQKLKPGDVRAIIAFTGADQQRTLALLGKYVEIYYPKLNTYQKYDLGSNSQMANQLLLLGFGSSGTELAQAYTIKYAGADNVGNRPASKLELVPKDPSVLAKIAKVDLWIPDDAGYPIQQQFFDPQPDANTPGNWRKVTYTNINLKPAISGTLEFKLPKGAKQQRD